MTALWDVKGNRLPVTILQISRAQVVSVKTLPKHGYWAVQIGIGLRSPRNVTKAMLGHFAAAGVAPKAKVGEFRVRDESGLLPVGMFPFIISNQLQGRRSTSRIFWRVSMLMFVELGPCLVGIHTNNSSKGKGFAGVMKRHGFHGLAASHGVSIKHRSGGSTGASQVICLLIRN